MTTITLSLDPVVLSDPTTGTVLDIASTLSFRSSTNRKLFSTVNELLAGMQAGDLFVLKAQTCCFLVSLTQEESNAEDQAGSPDEIDDPFNSQDSGVCLLPCDDAAACDKQRPQDGEVTSSIGRLVEAGLDTLVVGRRAVGGIRTLCTTRTPIICLVPEVFNMNYLSSLTNRSRLLPALSSVFQDLNHIESRRLRDYGSASHGTPAGSLQSAIQNHEFNDFGHRIWRLMRAQMPACEETKFSQQQSRELERLEEYPRVPAIDAMNAYGITSEDEASLHEEIGLTTNDGCEVNEDRDIPETLSDIDMEFDQNTPPSWTVDENPLLPSSPLTMTFPMDRNELRHEHEAFDDEDGYPEDISDHETHLEAHGSPLSPRPSSYFGITSEPNSEAESEAHKPNQAFNLADTSLPPYISLRGLVAVGPASYSDRSNFSPDMDEHDLGEGYDANDHQRQQSISLISYSDWRSDEDEDEVPFSELSFHPISHDRQPDDDDGMYGEPELVRRPLDYIWPSEVFSGSEIDLYDDQIE
ncbi:hypothetical protein CSIM01_08681 [Colletotrichum simmondsii]|uniref:Uncharacterized protein n=1 Tax=Colletotrichum simmondsii TaxID=703756 RepID=A0A135TJ81_9PEZI|nr:hypothetical protein CSIM01_08681 [Colletotrichum simmondsii]